MQPYYHSTIRSIGTLTPAPDWKLVNVWEDDNEVHSEELSIAGFAPVTRGDYNYQSNSWRKINGRTVFSTQLELFFFERPSHAIGLVSLEDADPVDNETYVLIPPKLRGTFEEELTILRTLATKLGPDSQAAKQLTASTL